MRSFSEHLPNNLRFLRKYYDFTQKELSEPFEVSQEGYSKWERGISRPSPRRLQKIADFYKISIPDILHKKPGELRRIILEQDVASSQKKRSDGQRLKHLKIMDSPTLLTTTSPTRSPK